jgi:hypothetical protein
MVLTKAELIGSLQNEVRILLHLATKVDHAKLDYRPTPKQRSTIELLQYLTVMGPVIVQCAKTGHFDVDAWTKSDEAAKSRSFDETVAALASQKETFATLLSGVDDADFRTEIEMFGMKQSRGSFLVNVVLSGYAAYRTQLFLYLKACGREELTTMNLWAGMDAPPS